MRIFDYYSSSLQFVAYLALGSFSVRTVGFSLQGLGNVLSVEGFISCIIPKCISSLTPLPNAAALSSEISICAIQAYVLEGWTFRVVPLKWLTAHDKAHLMQNRCITRAQVITVFLLPKSPLFSFIHKIHMCVVESRKNGA